MLEDRDYRRVGVEVVGVIGVGGSPSCGVHTSLDLAGAVDVPFEEHDLLDELGVLRRRVAPAP